MAIDDIQSRAEFFQVLGDALDQVRALELKFPNFWVYSNLEKQLAAMQEWTANGRTPKREERKRINIGLIAARELEPTDEIEMWNLCRRLYGLNYYFQYWPSDPNSPVKNPPGT